MKKIELFFAAILVPLDFLMLLLAALTAYFLRFQALAEIRPIIFELPFRDYIQAAAVVSLIWLVIFAFGGLYNIRGPRKILYELVRVFVACSTGMMVLIIWIFFQRQYFSSRFIILAAWVLSFLFVWIGRLIMRTIRLFLLRHGQGVHRTIVIGKSPNAKVLISELQKNTTLGFKVIANLAPENGSLTSRLDQEIEKQEIDDLILADANVGRDLMLELIDWADSNHVGFRYAADIFETQAANIEVSAIAGIPVVEFKKTPLEGWSRIYKRIFDIIVSFILIIVTSPVMIITAIAIKLDSKGPVFWSRLDDGTPANRVGQNEKPFHYFKFRSMKPGSHARRYSDLKTKDLRRGSPLVKIENDPRITRVGKFIRRFSIDELPELFLVLAGKMSLVGPRPHFPEEVAKYTQHQRKVFAIKPGITGLAQISGRSDMDFEDEINLDTYYMQNWSLLMDIAILLKTPLAVLRQRQAV